MEQIITKIINWIKSETLKANAKGVVVGVSGGVDSAIVASLAKAAFPEKSLGVFININNSKTNLEKAEIIFKETGIEEIILNENKVLKTLLNKINLKDDNDHNTLIIKGNMASRLRMTTLYAVAQKNDYLVLGTANKSELTIGYFTKWGDGVADLYPIASFTKNKIYEIAKELKINSTIINAKPSADLWENQEDEKELGFSYEDLDAYISNQKINPKIEQKIEYLIKKNNHKQININKFEL